MPATTASLLCRGGQRHGGDGIVGDRGGVEVADFGVHAVALANSLQPRTGAEGLGVGAAPPEIDSTRPAILGIDELLANQPRHIAEAGSNPAEMLGAGSLVDARRQPILNDRGDHNIVLLIFTQRASVTLARQRVRPRVRAV